MLSFGTSLNKVGLLGVENNCFRHTMSNYISMKIVINSYVDINHNVLSLYCFAFEKGVLLVFIRFFYSALSMISTITLKRDNGSTMICRLDISKDLADSIFTLVLRFQNTFSMW